MKNGVRVALIILLNIIIITIIVLIALGVIFYYIDEERVQNGEEPLFCKSQDWAYMDGGTKEYMGLGYKVIKFKRMSGYNKVKIGLWTMQYDDFEAEIEEFENAPIYMYSTKEPEDKKQLSAFNASNFRYIFGNLVYDKEITDDSMITYIIEDSNGATYYYRPQKRTLSQNDKLILLDDTSFEILNEIIIETMSIKNN